MNWEALAAFGEVAGAIAVVASLIFVGNQLRQAQAVERAKSQRDLLVQTREWMGQLGRDEQEFEAVRSCLQDFDGAADFDKERFNGWAFGLLLIMEQAHFMHRDGFLNESSFYGFEQAILSIIRTNGGAQWWRHGCNIIGKDVGDYLVNRLEEIGDSVPPWDELLPYLQAKSDTGN